MHELAQAARLAPELGFSPVVQNQTFRLLADEYQVACHRVGDFASQDIWRCFPDNTGAAHKLVLRQEWLPGMAPRIDTARNVVLAHLGNSETGLEAIYLCIPTAQDASRITEWGFVHPVWQRGDNGPSLRRPAPTPELPPEETVGAPVVHRKTKDRSA